MANRSMDEIGSSVWQRGALRALGAMAFALAVAACGGGGTTGELTATCSGAGCTCIEGNACTCTAGVDCHTTCDAEGCAVSCVGGAKCEANSVGPIALTCDATSTCKGNGGDGSAMTCTGSDKCELKGGGMSAVTCNTDADCRDPGRRRQRRELRRLGELRRQVRWGLHGDLRSPGALLRRLRRQVRYRVPGRAHRLRRLLSFGSMKRAGER
ncbi:MAG: hypothetical protein QM820_56490 [Minicystis sp.]